MQIDLHSGFQFGDTFLLGPPKRATSMDRPLYSGTEKMRMDWILVMVLYERVGEMPVHINKLLKMLRLVGWRRNDEEWRPIISGLAQTGCLRATLSDAGHPYEVFWPDRRDEDTTEKIREGLK